MWINETMKHEQDVDKNIGVDNTWYDSEINLDIVDRRAYKN